MIGARVKRELSIVQALEWAFRVECASLDFDELSGDNNRLGVSSVWVLMQRGAIGVEIDGGGFSSPHPDAEIIASALSSLPIGHGGRSMAAQIAALSRSGSRPDPMLSARQRCVPREWAHGNQHGSHARTEVVETIVTVHRGKKTRRQVLACPVTYSPTTAQIAAARREYLEWWGALLWLGAELRGLNILSTIMVTKGMPPMTPWIQHSVLK